MISRVNVTSMYFKKINLSLLWKLQRRDDRGQHTTTTATTRFLRRMIYVMLFVFSDLSVCYCPRPLPCRELYIRFVFLHICVFVCLSPSMQDNFWAPLSSGSAKCSIDISPWDSVITQLTIARDDVKARERFSG